MGSFFKIVAFTPFVYAKRRQNVKVALTLRSAVRRVSKGGGGPRICQPMPHAFIYILLCADGSFYTGITRRDPTERLSEHQRGIDPKCFTFRRRPLQLVFSECFERVDEAVATERRIKGWSRAKKQALIAMDYDALRRLASRAGR